MVFGRSAAGIVFSARSTQPVRLIFLLVTPNDQPDLQLSLLAQLATIAASEQARVALVAARTERDAIESLTAAVVPQPAPNGR